VIITIVIEQYGVTTNGISMTARQLAKVLLQHGHTVRILCGAGSGAPEEIYRTGVNRLPVLYQLCRSQGMLLALKNEKVIAEACSGADVVHMLMPSALCRAAKRFCDRNGIPTTAAFHLQPENITSTLHQGNIRFINDLVYARFRSFYNGFGHMHCPSEMIADQLRRHGYRSELHVISNGVSPLFRPCAVPKPAPFEGLFVLLMVGRLSAEKRQDLIVEAVRKSRYEKRIQILLAGQGPWEQHIQTLAGSLTNPIVIRYFPQEELLRVINYADLYVHASDVEIEAISCMEAFTCGLVPVISDSPLAATSNSPCRSTISSGTGRATPFGHRSNTGWSTRRSGRSSAGDTGNMPSPSLRTAARKSSRASCWIRQGPPGPTLPDLPDRALSPRRNPTSDKFKALPSAGGRRERFPRPVTGRRIFSEFEAGFTRASWPGRPNG
jgi:1,2-diacylglycerol 3-alpha-glucosyltransferase